MAVYAACGTVDRNNPFEYLECWTNTSGELNPTRIQGVGGFLGLGLNILLGTALAVSMIAIIMSGIKIVTSRGDPKAKGAAQQALTYSVLAFVLAIAAFTIKTIIFNVMGGDYGDLTNATPGI